MNIQWGPLGEMVFNRTYSRRVDDRHETWQETIKRVVKGNCSLLDEDFEPSEYEELMLEDLFLRFQALPAGRHLWVGGVEGRQFSFNCHRTAYGESLRDHLGFMMNVLMHL